MKAGRYIVFFLFFILSASLAYAEVKINQVPRSEYNVGEILPVSVSVNQLADAQGLLKITISCGGYSLTYSITPLILESGKEQKVEAPITLINPMVGECEIIANYEALDNSIDEQKRSSIFAITKDLEIEIVMETTSFLPEQEMVIAGTVRTKSGAYLGNGTMVLNFQEKGIKAEIKDGRFRYKIEVSPSLRSGRQFLLFLVEDKNGNHGELSQEIEIIAVPSRLDFKLNKKGFDPLESLQVTPYLYDQSNTAIQQNVDLKLEDSSGKLVLDKAILSGDNFSYTFEKQAAPGTWKLTLTNDKISKKDTFTIKEIQDTEINLEGILVSIKNTGNVPYKDEVSISLKGDSDTLSLEKDVNLKPGESLEIDLSQELKAGTYEVTLPNGEVIEQVEIPDNRGFLKKTWDIITSPISIGSFEVSLWIIILVLIVIFQIYRKTRSKK